MGKVGRKLGDSMIVVNCPRYGQRTPYLFVMSKAQCSSSRKIIVALFVGGRGGGVAGGLWRHEVRRIARHMKFHELVKPMRLNRR